MNTDLLTATNRLCDVLAAENAALAALDLPRAAAMLDAKQAAMAALTAARSAGPTPHSPALQQGVGRLRELAEENRRLLERGLAVQSRVLAVIASAARASHPAPRYGRSGGYADRPSSGWALSARA